MQSYNRQFGNTDTDKYTLTDWFVFLTQQQKDANDLLLHPMAKAIGTNYKQFAGNFNDDLLIALIYYGIAKIEFIASDFVRSSMFRQIGGRHNYEHGWRLDIHRGFDGYIQDHQPNRIRFALANRTLNDERPGVIIIVTCVLK